MSMVFWNYPNAKYGDFKEVCDEIYKSKDCITID